MTTKLFWFDWSWVDLFCHFYVIVLLLFFFILFDYFFPIFSFISHLIASFQCNTVTRLNTEACYLFFLPLYHSQSMAALVFGHLGQRVVKRVVLVLNQEADPVITQPLPVGDKTALGTPLKQRVAKSSHVQVRNSYFVCAFMKVRQSVVFM